MPAQRLTIEGIGMLSFETTVTLSVGYEVAHASPDTESLYPTGQITWNNLDGSYLDVDDDPDSPDGNWGVPLDNNTDTCAHVSFDTPPGNLTTGAGLQEFRIWVKKWDGTGTPAVRIVLYENGLYVSEVMGYQDVTSDTGELFYATWDASLLSNIDGSGVECYVYGKKCGGASSTRATVAVGAIEWNAEYSVAANISNLPTSRDFGLVDENSSYWSNTTAPTFPLEDAECYFTVTNNGSGAVNISIKAADFSGGVGWTLVTAAPGQNQARLTVWESGDGEGDGIYLTTTDAAFISNLAASDCQEWELRLETGTFTDGAGKSSTITLTAAFV